MFTYTDGAEFGPDVVKEDFPPEVEELPHRVARVAFEDQTASVCVHLLVPGLPRSDEVDHAQLVVELTQRRQVRVKVDADRVVGAGQVPLYVLGRPVREEHVQEALQAIKTRSEPLWKREIRRQFFALVVPNPSPHLKKEMKREWQKDSATSRTFNICSVLSYVPLKNEDGIYDQYILTLTSTTRNGFH